MFDYPQQSSVNTSETRVTAAGICRSKNDSSNFFEWSATKFI